MQNIFYTGNFHKDYFPKLNGQRILWLAFTKDIAESYAKRWYTKDMHPKVYTIYLKPECKIVRMDDLSNKYIRQVYENLSMILKMKFGYKEISEQDWKQHYSNFDSLENYPWIRTFLVSKKIGGVVVQDNNGPNLKHESVALFSTKYIEKYDPEILEPEKEETLSEQLLYLIKSKAPKHIINECIEIYEYLDKRPNSATKENN